MATMTIPSRWLQGAMLVRERAGMPPREAMVAAIAAWNEQAALALQWAREHGQEG